MPVFYHATAAKNRESIERYGFRPGCRGMDGPGIYFCKNPEAAVNRARIPRGQDAVVFGCTIPDYDVTNVKNEDNFKVEGNNASCIRLNRSGHLHYDAKKVSQIKNDKSHILEPGSQINDLSESKLRPGREAFIACSIMSCIIMMLAVWEGMLFGGIMGGLSMGWFWSLI